MTSKTKYFKIAMRVHAAEFICSTGFQLLNPCFAYIIKCVYMLKF